MIVNNTKIYQKIKKLVEYRKKYFKRKENVLL